MAEFKTGLLGDVTELLRGKYNKSPRPYLLGKSTAGRNIRCPKHDCRCRNTLLCQRLVGLASAKWLNIIILSRVFAACLSCRTNIDEWVKIPCFSSSALLASYSVATVNKWEAVSLQWVFRSINSKKKKFENRTLVFS